MAERWSAEAEDDRSAWKKSIVKDRMGMIVICRYVVITVMMVMVVMAMITW